MLFKSSKIATDMLAKNLTNYLTKATGYNVNNNNGEFLGKIAGTMQDQGGEVLEYIILKSDHFLGADTAFLRSLQISHSSIFRKTEKSSFS